MTVARLIRNSIVHHRRIHLAVALAVATASMVLSGALLVGDSVRGSLRALALQRLGRIDDVLVSPRFFRQQLATQLAAQPGLADEVAVSEPAIFLAASLTDPSTGHLAGQVTLIGSRAGFWELGSGGPRRPPRADEIVLNTHLAGQLNVGVGAAVMLQIGQPGDIPADSPLGRKTDTIRRERFVVREIIPTAGLGRFGLQPSQQLPSNAFVALETVQKMLDRSGRVNAILVARRSTAADPADAGRRLAAWLHPQLTDFGLRLDEVHLRDGPRTVTRYFHLTSDRLLLAPPVVAAARRAWQGHTVQEALTYLANSISQADQAIPYSTVTAIDSIPGLGPLWDDDGRPLRLREDQIALNDWGTRDGNLSVRIGDTLSVTYFEPDTTHGQVREASVGFQLAAVVPLGGDGGPLTPAADRALTPEVPGVTDQAAMDDWNPPFPFDATRIRPRDEAYWRAYRATPKGFVSLGAGRRLWGSRFGDTTSIRVAADTDMTREGLAQQLLAEIDPLQLGFVFQPIKSQALQASSGTTPFDVLFLLFSAFLIAAALMLVSLLFRLGIEQRAAEVGMFLALGFRPATITWLLAVEGFIVAGVGALFGTLAGLGYAAVMLAGLRTWWLEAVSTPFLRLHPTAGSLTIGLLGGLTAGGLTILGSLHRAGHLPPRLLLAGRFWQDDWRPQAVRRWPRWTAAGAMLLASALAGVAMLRGGEMRTGIFFTAGGLVLLAGLLEIHVRLQLAGKSSAAVNRYGSWWLARSNAARNPLRSTLTIGLMATACFLIIAVSAFRLDETDAASGGYNLLAQSTAPIYHDLSSQGGQFELGIDPLTAQLLAKTETIALRVQAGQDASCLNLYRPRQPRILGLPRGISPTFRWAAVAADTHNPWDLLHRPPPPSDPAAPDRAVKTVPVILDENTAMYSLHLWKGVGESLTLEDERGRPVRLQIVALLKNSIFQGDVLMSDENFLKMFPSTGGHRMFLMRTAEGTVQQLQAGLERRLSDFGFDVTRTQRRLEELFAVQNTYLATFQSLGGLGLLLGTCGLATVQLRNVMARRGELAVMRAAGFRRRHLAAIVMIE
ncbi:MAG: hypothetical protein GTO03_01420, partial [Planctomycetales bacterium]|nr:hypothetical protein [Planctomycetales bacterium]